MVPLQNGTYNFSVGTVDGYSATAAGFVTVRGMSAHVAVAFSRVDYTLTFNETGLPNGTGWAISIASTIESSLSRSIQFQEPNGTYDFVILAITGYVTAYSGFAVVDGIDQVVSVAFHPQTYPIVFIELGLPAGSNWSVTVSNVSNGFNETQSSTGSSITFFLPNGTYAFSFTLPPGFSGNSSSSQITVAGKATTGATLTIGPAWARTAQPSSTAWTVAALGAIVILGLAVVVLVVQRVRRPPSVGPPPR